MAASEKLLTAKKVFEKAKQLEGLRSRLLPNYRYVWNETKRSFSILFNQAAQKSDEGGIKLPRENFPGDKDFTTVCQHVIEVVKTMDDANSWNFLDKEKLKLAKATLEGRQVLISFYGDSNVGKSTLLNGILRDRYLPSRQDAETGMSVYIYFRESFHPPLKFPHEGVLCKEMNPSAYIAKGAIQIQKELKQLNSQRRLSVTFTPPAAVGEAHEHTPSEVYVYLNRYFGEAFNNNVRFIMLDNPGFGEYGSAEVEESVQKSRANSAAFIFVTTMDTYQMIGSSRVLKELYNDNTKMFKQNRLLIVITKLDLILQSKRGEDTYTEEEALMRVRKFLCLKLNIASEDLPNNAVIAVSGEWALSTREPKGDDYDSYIDLELGKLRAEERQTIKETPGSNISERLEKRSNILQLEHRLEEMAKDSLITWKRKVSHDLIDLMASLKKGMTIEQHLIDKKLKEVQENITNFSSILVSSVQIYQEIISYLEEKNHPKDDSNLWKLFKGAYAKDIERGDCTTSENLMEFIRKSAEDFKDCCKNKIARKTYTPQDLENDITEWLTGLANYIEHTLTSEECYTYLIKVYEGMCQEKYGSIVALSASLQQILESDESAVTSIIIYDSENELPSIHPKIKMELNKSSLKLPMGEFKILEAFKNFFRILFRRKREQENLDKEFTVEVDYRTGAQAATQSQSKEKTIRVYKKWTEGHDKLISDALQEVEKIINDFNCKKEKYILKRVYVEQCETLYSILKTADKVNDELFKKLNDILKENMKKLARLKENEKTLCSKIMQIDTLRHNFVDYCDY